MHTLSATTLYFSLANPLNAPVESIFTIAKVLKRFYEAEIPFLGLGSPQTGRALATIRF